MKVLLAPQVRLFLETEAMPEETEAFQIRIRDVRQDPVGQSEPYLGRTDTPRAMRWFRFGGCIAIFEYLWTGDPDTDRLLVAKCLRKRIIPSQ